MTHSVAQRHQDSNVRRSTEPLYAHIVEEVKDGGLTNADIGRVIGVAERQVRNWAHGENAPTGKNRDKLLELHYVARLLRDVYTREGAEIWIHGRKKSLSGKRPIDLLTEGEYEAVWHAIERLHTGAM